jgi:hypothetical protein
MMLEPVQMLWVRGALSRLELLSIRSFLAQGHPVQLYTYEQPPNAPAQVALRDASEIVESRWVPSGEAKAFGKGTLGAFSDFFRYHLLLRRGGWWSDLDVVALKPWSGFPEVVTASTDERGHGRVANGFVMRFPEGHPVMRECAGALSPERIGVMGIDETGPLLLNRALGREGVARFCASPEVFAPVPWNAGWQLLRPAWRRWTPSEWKQRLRRPHLSMRFRRGTVGVHLWNETWRAQGLDKNARQTRTCLYERLQRRFNPAGEP